MKPVSEELRYKQRAFCEQVAVALHNYMQQRGISLAQVATRLEVPEDVVCQMLAGRHSFGLDELVQVLDALNAGLRFAVVPNSVHDEIERVVRQHEVIDCDHLLGIVTTSIGASRKVVVAAFMELHGRGVIEFTREGEVQISPNAPGQMT